MPREAEERPWHEQMTDQIIESAAVRLGNYCATDLVPITMADLAAIISRARMVELPHVHHFRCVCGESLNV